ncbi:MAG: hypothetical protein U9Q81_11930 [Pseudomonadota bacterium]|nr:hypothetical protein [Pseudomonadota bacterium]
MHYKVFYFFERSGETVSSASPVQMSAKAIREQLLHRFHSEDDYLGIIDDQDNTLQILCEPGEDRYWVELPMEKARASYGRYMSLADLEELMLSLPQVLDRSHIPDMEYRPW